MAVDMFLKIDDIEGESVDDVHAGEIDILSWSWGMSQSGTTHTGPGGGAGKVNLILTMEGGLISSVSTGGSGGEDRITENITLNFSEFKTEYVPQMADGSGDASIIVGWNIANNVDAS